MDQKACEQLHNVCLKMGDYVDKWYTLHLSQIILHKVINKLILPCILPIYC
jgi:hypothetical protein